MREASHLAGRRRPGNEWAASIRKRALIVPNHAALSRSRRDTIR